MQTGLTQPRPGRVISASLRARQGLPVCEKRGKTDNPPGTDRASSFEAPRASGPAAALTIAAPAGFSQCA